MPTPDQSVPRTNALSLPVTMRLVALLLVACHPAPQPAADRTPCPGPYTIERGTCEHVPPTECRGVCGYIVRRNGCTPVRQANITTAVVGSSPATSSDETGRFDLVGLAPGHYTLRVNAERDEARIELDVVGGAQPLATPLELTLFSRSCACGGACTN